VTTDCLFAQPSMISGAARTFDLFGLFDYYNFSQSGREADGRALYSDFYVIGQDLLAAINLFKSEQHEGPERPEPLQFSIPFGEEQASLRA